MNQAEILTILNDWNFWKIKQETGIIREGLLKRLEELYKLNEIVVVSGVRRCGKSTLLLQFCKNLIEKGVRKEDILIINLEDPRWKNLDLELLNRVYEVYVSELEPKEKHYVVLDEVQVVDGWEKFARFLHENKKVHVFMTGSSSKLLSSEYSSVLAGRHVDMEIHPLYFKEFLEFKGIKIENRLDIVAKRHKLRKLLSEYLKWGGFPKVALTEKEEGKRDILNAYFRDIIIKDVVIRHRIREVDKLEELAKYYLTNISSLQSFNKIKNFMNLSLDSIERFSGYLSSVYLISFSRKFSYSLKGQILNPKKVYCIDSGLRTAVGFFFSEDLGRIVENVAFLELSRRYEGIYYWKDYQQREVDFVIKEDKQVKQLVQVTYASSRDEIAERELKALLKASKELECRDLLVVSWDYEGEEEFKGKKIKFVPLWKWLLVL
jgi:uncharacterized protein